MNRGNSQRKNFRDLSKSDPTVCGAIPRFRDRSLFRPLFMNGKDYSTQHLMCSSPQMPRSYGLMRASGRTASYLSHHQSGATDRPASEMNEMPVVCVAVLARILTHRRDEHPIGKRQISNGERIKQAGHLSYRLSVFSRGYRSEIKRQVFQPLPRGLRLETGLLQLASM
jgi:hypothetical protein